jgi:tetratricopeptide (TPR) repeat protein
MNWNLILLKHMLGLLLADKGEGQKALEKLREATDRRPGYADAYNWIGWFSNVIGEHENALINSRKAVELNPLSPEALSNLALAHLINGDFETAIRQARQIQILNPEWSTSYFYEALGLYHTGQLGEAETVLKDLVVDWAGNAIENIHALIWFRNGAESKFSKMQNKFQQQNDHFGSALLYAATNDAAKALGELKKIKKWNYWNSIAIFSLFKEEFKALEAASEFISIKEKAKNSWGV